MHRKHRPRYNIERMALTRNLKFFYIISEVIMQLIVRGEQTHVLDVAPTANVQALRAQLSLLEVSVSSESLDSNCSHFQ